MHINGVDVAYHVESVEDNQRFSLAFQEVQYKARVHEDAFQKGELSEEKYQKKQVKLIKKFFIKVSDEETAQALFRTCHSYDDYVRAFGTCSQKIATASMLMNAIKSKVNPKRRIKKRSKR